MYRPDPDLPPDHSGRVPCVCGALPDNRRHEAGEALPDVDDDVRALEARRLGEHE